jgi:uncharacterized protein involved in outer membrane biogenesis
MKRWLRISLLVIAAVLLLGLIVPYVLNVDHYRSVIASAIEKETGRKAMVGSIRARLLPKVGFVIENFSLGNPPGFTEGNLLSVEAIHGSLAWGPLLQREFQLSSIELVRPRLMLLEDDRGEVNYDLSPKKKAAQPSSGPAFRIADIDSIELRDGELILARVTGHKRAIVPTLRAQKIVGELRDVALDPNRLKQWKAEADLAGVQLDLTGLKRPIQFRSGQAKLRGGALESKFTADLAGAAELTGSVRVADVEKGVANFQLSTPVLDLEKVAAAGAETAPAVPSRPSPAKSELVAQGRLAAERIRWPPYEAGNGTAEIRVFTDRVEAWPIAMALYAGTLQISARLDRRQVPERFSANIQVRNLDVARALAATPETRGKMTGTGELTLQIFGSLGRSILNSLTGTGNFAVRDGRFPGFHLGGALQTMAKLQQVFTLGAGSGGMSGDTPFSLISGDLGIRQARVSSNRIHLDSPSGKVDLQGSFGFDSTLDYNGQAVLMRDSTGGAQNPIGAITGVLGGVMKQTVGRVSVPFAVRGTFHDPKIQPGRGLPSFETSSPSQPAEEQQQKKKSIFDLFRRP